MQIELENVKFIQLALCTASQTEKTKLPKTSQTLKDLFTTVYECLKIYTSLMVSQFVRFFINFLQETLTCLPCLA